MTKIFLKTWLFLFIPIFFGCSSVKMNKQPMSEETALAAFETGDFETALAAYETVIERFKNARQTDQCPVYGKAGIAALKTGDKNKAIEYFEMDTYTPFVTSETYYNMALFFREIDNLSREIMALSDYLQKFQDAENADEVKLRLFETYIISQNWDLAIPVWEQLQASQKYTSDILEKGFILNKAIENTYACNELANQLLSLDSDNQMAMEWIAIRIFDSAEERYNREMKAYENNRTNRQYLRLLDELEKSTQEFRVALDYFDKLFKNHPQNKYALFISNIYVRFNDKEKADYYRKMAGINR